MSDKKDVLTIRSDSYVSFNKDRGNYTITNKRVFHDAIIMSVPAFLKLESELFKTFGSVAAQILEITGEAAGGESAKRIANVGNLEDDIRFIFNSVSKWGFGRYELVDLDMQKGIVKFNLYDNPLVTREEKGSSIDKTKTTHHHFLIGFYTGYFSILFEEQVVCKETMCMNNGEKSCQFEVKKLV